tara:strand:- start:1457 stop:2734 length:1278 start_codon:yes stop_codon:yes gene_type:complete
MVTYDEMKAKEKRDKKLKEIQNIKSFIEGMKRNNDSRWQHYNSIDVNPETVCKPIGEFPKKWSNQCQKNRDTRGGILRQIRDDEQMIITQQAKLIQKQSDFDKGITIIEEAKTLQERGGYEVRGVPKSGSITFSGITENSVLVSWNFDQGDLPITGYHLVIKDEDTRQTKFEFNPSYNTTNTIVSPLDSGINYSAFIIATNEIGNSIEISSGFKTKGVSAIIEKTVQKDSTQSSFISDLIPSVPEVFAETIENKVYSPLIVEDTSIKQNMISQSIGAFKLENGKVTGDIIYVAEKSFNPYYYNKLLTSIVQIRDPSGFTITIKPNDLNFTATERDERISINENVGDINAVKIEFYVWKNLQNPSVFAEKKEIQIVAGLEPCPIGQHRDFSGNCVLDNEVPRDKLMDTLKGFLFGTVALSLLARKY